MNNPLAIYAAARERRGLPSRPLSNGELAAELRKAADGLETGDDATFSGSLARFLAEFFSASEGGNLLKAARAASGER